MSRKLFSILLIVLLGASGLFGFTNFKAVMHYGDAHYCQESAGANAPAGCPQIDDSFVIALQSGSHGNLFLSLIQNGIVPQVFSWFSLISVLGIFLFVEGKDLSFRINRIFYEWIALHNKVDIL